MTGMATYFVSMTPIITTMFTSGLRSPGQGGERKRIQMVMQNNELLGGGESTEGLHACLDEAMMIEA